MSDNLNATEIHPFEKAGLGKAPFRYIGAVAQDVGPDGLRKMGTKHGVEWSTTPGGTCDACGKAIVDIYRVQSSDGKISTVGCDCIKKVGGSTVKNVAAFENDRKVIAKAKSRAKKVNNDARDDARIAAAFARLDEATKLRETPHPTAWGLKAGLTLADYVRWMGENAGRSGKLSAAKMIEKALP